MPPIPSDPKIYKEIKEKVKSQFGRWPSAYASGMLVKTYTAHMRYLGREPYVEHDKPSNNTGLARWFREKWIDVKTGLACGSAKTATYYPTCRPSKRVSSKTPTTASELSNMDKRSMITRKQRAKTRTVLYQETARK